MTLVQRSTFTSRALEPSVSDVVLGTGGGVGRVQSMGGGLCKNARHSSLHIPTQGNWPSPLLSPCFWLGLDSLLHDTGWQHW